MFPVFCVLLWRIKHIYNRCWGWGRRSVGEERGALEEVEEDGWRGGWGGVEIGGTECNTL